jgi:NAD(P)-dependent dehydrogenase (short-subunit alcohol dehydrogenase family)
VLFAEQGARVAVVGRSVEHTERTVTRIVRDGGEAVALLGDATCAADCERIVACTIARFGRLDVLVNNLGIAAGGSVADVDPETWRRVLSVNLESVVLMSKHGIREMRKTGGGSIINVGSVAGLQASGSAAYGASKAGLIGLTREMAFAHGRDGIRVNCLVPGHLHTPMGAQGGDPMRELRRQVNMLGIEGTARDLAWAAVFLASDEARFITASALPVDGGVTAELTLAVSARLQG